MKRHRLGMRSTVAVVAAAAAFALAGCGVSTGGPSAIPTSQVPFNLLVKNPTTTTTTTTPQNSIQQNVYFANTTGQLVPVQRLIPVHSKVSDAVQYLLQGPSQGETNEGLLTYLGNVKLLDASATTNQPNVPLVTVDLNGAFGEISGSAQVLAVGQIVLTVTAYEKSSATQVLFQIGGIPKDVPTGNGSQAFTPVTWLDYASLLVPPSTTTTSP